MANPVFLNPEHIDDMLELQRMCIKNNDLFIPSRKETYLKCFIYDNFCYGVFHESILIAFVNCSIPTSRSKSNLGIGIVNSVELDSVGQINTILIHRDFRRNGLGRLLTASCLKQFATNIKNKIKYIFTTVDPNNVASLRMFYGFNFINLRMKIYNINGVELKRLVLLKRLEEV